MPAIDFNEIPAANECDGKQDTFELFARDFIEDIIGLKIISQPDRGADGGKDILAEERQTGTISSTRVKWLISCKHYSHSGKSVGETDEQNILDRMAQHHAAGFMGFYSTLPSAGLNERLNVLKDQHHIKIFDREGIEKNILQNSHTNIFKRYFPNSYQKWQSEHDAPTLLLSEYQKFPCEVCGKDLLKDKSNGLIIFTHELFRKEICNVFGVCRGDCDRELKQRMRAQKCGTGWESIEDITLPTMYLKHIMATMNNLNTQRADRRIFTKEGFKSYKNMLISISQLTLRSQTDAEWKRVQELNMIPDGL